MLFKLFSRHSHPSADRDGETPALDIDAERALLSAALYNVLETLPQSFSGRENIRILCEAIATASAHLRFVWIGFPRGEPVRQAVCVLRAVPIRIA